MNHHYIKTIKHNFKSVDAKFYDDLLPHVLVVGPNASGKTALLSAIKVALTGTADDFAGRATVASESMLQAMQAPGAEDEYLFSEVTLNTGEKFSWRRKPGQKAEVERPTFDVMFPYADIEDAIKGSRATTIDFLASNFAPDAKLAAWARDAVSQRDMWRIQLKTHKDTSKAIEVTLATMLQGQAEDPKRELFTLIKSLLTRQTKGLTADTVKCGVCGAGHPTLDLTARLDKVNIYLQNNGGESYAGLFDRAAVLRDIKADADAKAVDVTSQISALDKQLLEMIRSARSQIEREFNGFKLNWSLGLQVDDKVCLIGKRRDAAFVYQGLSGAEMIGAVGAIAAALTLRRLRTEKTLTVFLTPDRNLDNKTLSTMRTAYKEVPGNFILQTAQKPKGRPPHGWVVIPIGTHTKAGVEEVEEDGGEELDFSGVADSSDNGVSDGNED